MHPGAQIGGGCFIDHATSVVIGETATIGRDCTILHGVTLVGTGKARTKRHPSIGDRVTLGVGATIVGDIRNRRRRHGSRPGGRECGRAAGHDRGRDEQFVGSGEAGGARARGARRLGLRPELHLVAPDSDAGAAAWHGGKGVGSKGGGRKETS